jgi:LuxR family transcriptional regulator, maltose regulon positive regulatory protein
MGGPVPDSAEIDNDDLQAGYAALAAYDWKASRAHFRRAVAADETAEALEGLGMASWWLDDAGTVFDSRESAYRLYRQRGDRAGAARMATLIATDYYIYRGELAVTNGWLQRARRLLEGLEPSFEHCLLTMWSGHIALFEDNDVPAARAASTETIALARQLGIVDLEVLALALEGLVLVSAGDVDEGMRRLDESVTAALAGDVEDPDAVVTACCYLLYACERVRDFDRALQWCAKTEEYCRRTSYRSMFGVCRSHYAAVLMWCGDWRRADEELTSAVRNLQGTRPGWVVEAALRLAELRRRQGRLDDSVRLYEQVPAHPDSLLGQAAILFERGDAETAADLVDRFLRRVPPDDLIEHVRGLELAVHVRVALGHLDLARQALGEIEDAAERVSTEPLRASAHYARAMIHESCREYESARRAFEDAVDLYQRCGAPYETALARVGLARSLLALDRVNVAAGEARAALDTFRHLGASREAGRAAGLLRDLGSSLLHSQLDLTAVTGLTRREIDVLRLIARGESNQEIADHLFLSIRTVERHISSIYQKLGVHGKAARAVATAFAIEHDLNRQTG